mmetsp:Transcript_6805/g.15703  ORF Transcript_6805/g.15703 Transcript_6805/m.15703 type:complete len:115 (-) Transcript_6805:157-501(-)
MARRGLIMIPNVMPYLVRKCILDLLFPPSFYTRSLLSRSTILIIVASSQANVKQQAQTKLKNDYSQVSVIPIMYSQLVSRKDRKKSMKVREVELEDKSVRLKGGSCSSSSSLVV